MISIETLKVDQVIITEGDTRTLFSYDTPIVSKTPSGVVLHDAWDYSVTTGKYRNIFLGNTKSDVVKLLKQGTYILRSYYD